MCTGSDANAVTVVVDFQSLGGGTQQYCVSGLAAGATSLDALRATGASVQGTVHDGLNFVCRINGRPGEGQALTLPNGDSYVESCVNTPPTTAYWSFWSASQGGGWNYAVRGAVSRRVVFGEYEGWSFSLGGGLGQAPAPRAGTPVWEAPPPPPPTTEAPTQAAPPPVQNSQPAQRPTQAPATSQATRPSQAPATQAVPPTQDAPTDAPQTQSEPTTDSPAEPAETAGVSESPTPSTGPGAWATPFAWSNDSFTDFVSSPAVVGAGSVVGVVLIGLVVGAAGFMLWRRRHRR